MPQRHVILADCFSRSGLAVARSLGRRGIGVTAIARSRRDLVARSRYLAARLIGPDPVAARDEYADFVAAAAAESGAELVIPVTDAAVAALNRRRARFADPARLALPAADAVDRVLDKRRNLALARELGVPCPRAFDLRTRAEIPAMIDALRFPIVVKDPTPDDENREKPLPFRVAIARDRPELEQLLALVESSDARPLYQEFVAGEAINVCVFAADGEVLACHGYVSRRRSSHEGVARDIVELDAELAEYARRMVGALRWSGVAHLQFFVDPATGKRGYMETNGRFWASTQGSINAGWDFPWWFFRWFADGERPQVPPIRIGSRTVYRTADLENLLRHLVHGPAPSSGYVGRAAAVWQTLRDFRPGVHADVWSWSDPLPSLHDVSRLFAGSNVSRLFRRPA